MDQKVLDQLIHGPQKMRTAPTPAGERSGITVTMSKETFDSHISKARAAGIEFGQNHLVEILYGFMIGITPREEIQIKLEGPAAEERLIHVMNALDRQLTLSGGAGLSIKVEKIRRELVNNTHLKAFTVDVLVDSFEKILRETL